MAAMRTKNNIVYPQMGKDTRRNSLLANIGVTCAVHQTTLMRSGKAVLQTAELTASCDNSQARRFCLAPNFLVALPFSLLKYFGTDRSARIHRKIAAVHRDNRPGNP